MDTTEKLSTENFIASQIKLFQNSIGTQLPNYNTPTMDNIICMFLLYDRVVRTHFILWLMLTLKKASTAKGQQVALENLKCEIEENHPQMLLDVIVAITTKSFSIIRTQKYYKQIREASQKIEASLERLTLQCHILGNGFFLMALLENGSLEFIPWMEKAADHRLGIKPEHLKYFQIHGEADKEHATQFTAACIEEWNSIYKTQMITDEGRNVAVALRKETELIFEQIFSFLHESE